MLAQSSAPMEHSRIEVDATRCRSAHTRRNKLGRMLWAFVWTFLFRLSPRFLQGWRRFLLRAFGASIGRGACIYPSARIWAPWNLKMSDYSCISFDVDCYCVDQVTVGAHATVSQYSFLCTATHDITRADMPLVTAPIVIGDGAWVAADAFIAPGVTVGEGAVVAARSTVLKDVQPWTVVGGAPAKFLKARELRQ